MYVCMYVCVFGLIDAVCVDIYTTLLTLQIHIWLSVILYIDDKFQLVCTNGAASQPHALPRLLCHCKGITCV